jgi:hypothetical protein
VTSELKYGHEYFREHIVKRVGALGLQRSPLFACRCVDVIDFRFQLSESSFIPGKTHFRSKRWISHRFVTLGLPLPSTWAEIVDYKIGRVPNLKTLDLKFMPVEKTSFVMFPFSKTFLDPQSFAP